MNLDKYIKKENYIVRDSDPNQWRNHPNGEIISHYSNITKGNVLDFGCNHGACTFLIKEITSVEFVVGYDINKESIDIALKSKDFLNKKNINFICGNFLEEIFEIKFDTIFTFHTLEHIFPEDLIPIIKKFYDVTNKDGHVIVSIPYGNCYEDITHVNFFEVNDLRNIFEIVGFETIECIIDERWSEGRGCLLTGIFKKK